MKQPNLLLAVLGTLALTSGCSKKSDANTSTGAPATESAKPVAATPKQPLTAAFFGTKAATPPGELAKVKPGMPKDEAAKLSPLATKSSSEPTEIEGVSLAIMDSPEGVDLMVSLPAAKAGVIEEAWGPGVKTDRGGTPVTVWFNTDAKIRASLEVSGDEANLRFEPYVPVAELLGTGTQLALLDQGFVGKTKEELIAQYPAIATKSGRLALPGTEWSFGGTLSLSPFPMSGPIESLAFAIPFTTPDGQDAILEAIEAKWGAVKEETVYGGEKALVYNKKDPRVQVTQSARDVTIRMLAK